MDTLEIHVPIMPTAPYLTQVLYFAASRLFCGGPLAHSKLVVHVGDEGSRVDLEAGLQWPEALNVEWRWVEPSVFRRYSYCATGFERFRQKFSSKYVLMADACSLMTSPIWDLADALHTSPAVAGVIAHSSPFGVEPLHTPEGWWKLLFKQAGLPEPRLDYEHTGWGIMNQKPAERFSPAYFNLGFVMAPADMMNALGERLYTDMDTVNSTLFTDFRNQLALSLGLARLQLPIKALPMKYNFPNYLAMAQAYPEDLQDLRMLRYLDRSEIDKDRDFGSPLAVQKFLTRRDVNSISRLFQEKLQAVQNALYGLLEAHQLTSEEASAAQ